MAAFQTNISKDSWPKGKAEEAAIVFSDDLP